MVRAATTDGNSKDPTHNFHKKHGQLDFKLLYIQDIKSSIGLHRRNKQVILAPSNTWLH